VRHSPSIIFTFIPTVLLSAVGILILVFQRAGFDIVLGILVLIFSSAVFTGGVIGMAILRRDARQIQLQTDFVSKVSHELRTPLASIRMFVDTLERNDVDGPERARCLAAVSAETSRLTSMIERLLSWGRMESGRRIYDLRPERVDALVGEALAQMDSQLRETGVEVRLELPDHSPAVMADRPAMVETLLNLMRNAVKYGATGGVLIVRVQEEKKKVVVEVADRGPGIPRREQRRVFEKFYRGSAARELESASGSGLGLAMARLVVKAHGGRILLVSGEGDGALFQVRLPSLPPEQALEVPPG